MINIRDLTVFVGEKAVLSCVNLKIEPGTINVLMGKNGSGKSSLAHTLMGHPRYTIKSGEISLDGQDLVSMSVEKRARAGIFLACQNPIEIPGVSVFTFLKEAYRILCDQNIETSEFQKKLFEIFDLVNLDHSFIYRNFNEGFSGGEKKRLEIAQLLLLRPKIAILDEIDSGIDSDGIKLLIKALKFARKTNPDLSILLITHYQKILEYLEPDYVHVISNGKIISSGNKDIISIINEKGYDAISQQIIS